MRGLFITGSDTGVGKTYISCQLLETISRQLSVTPCKPVESGCELIDGNLFPADANALRLASQSQLSLDMICPNTFSDALSPQLAARIADRRVSLEQLADHCKSLSEKSDILLVEGAGGFLSPICEKALNADLAHALNLPVVLVVDDRLGGVNQALMGLNAIQHYQLQARAVILNQTSQQTPPHGMDNAAELAELSPVPVFTNAYGQSLDTSTLSSILHPL